MTREEPASNQVGYALTMDQVIQEFNQARADGSSVGTGSCAD